MCLPVTSILYLRDLSVHSSLLAVRRSRFAIQQIWLESLHISQLL